MESLSLSDSFTKQTDSVLEFNSLIQSDSIPAVWFRSAPAKLMASKDLKKIWHSSFIDFFYDTFRSLYYPSLSPHLTYVAICLEAKKEEGIRRSCYLS